MLATNVIRRANCVKVVSAGSQPCGRIVEFRTYAWASGSYPFTVGVDRYRSLPSSGSTAIHDTYYVVAHFHTYEPWCRLAIFAGIYFTCPSLLAACILNGRELTFGEFIVRTYFFPQHLGSSGKPRRSSIIRSIRLRKPLASIRRGVPQLCILIFFFGVCL